MVPSLPGKDTAGVMQTATDITIDRAEGVYYRAFEEGLRPTPDMWLSDWADANFILPRKGNVEPGRFRVDRTPYLREILNNLSPRSPVRSMAVMKGTQLGFTTVGLIWFVHTVVEDPSSMMMLMPTDKLMKRHSKLKVAPLIEENLHIMRGKIKDARVRDSGNTIDIKEFTGGELIMSGVESAANLRNASVKKFIRDEIDAFVLDVEGEGDPLDLSENRGDAYGSSVKIYDISSPTLKNTSRIAARYEESDQRKFFVPCPNCNHPQFLLWKNFKLEYDQAYNLTDDVTYTCAACGFDIAEHHKTWMLTRGEWMPTREGKFDRRGYHLPSFYSPIGWLSWNKIAKEFLLAKKTRNPIKLKRVINTRFAEPWRDAEDMKIVEGDLYNRREEYAEPLPVGIGALTCAVDVQADRLECEVKGWGKYKESWGVEYKIFMGDPTKTGIWDDLDEFLLKSYSHAAGVRLQILCAAIDTGGHHSDMVSDFVRIRQSRHIIAVKGASTYGKPIISNRPSKRNRGRVYLYMVGTDTAKSAIFSRLMIREPGPGYMHFPVSDAYDQEYFRQLNSEEMQPKKTAHGIQRVFTPKPGIRNEVLDVTVYNWAALKYLETFQSFDLVKICDMLIDYRREHETAFGQDAVTPRPVRVQAAGGRRVFSKGVA